ncbi:MAG TPA: hypothetical protein VFW65_32495 [Pseudonocardiaceae bacterium]|nr:hypothetical protein [Pseudonocardiaceae bacterium]
MADDTAGQQRHGDDQPDPVEPATIHRAIEVSPVDVVLGLGVRIAVVVWRASSPVRWVAGRVFAAAPPSVTVPLADRGQQLRVTVEQVARRVLVAVAPRVVRTVLDSLDLTALVRQHVDLDQLVAGVDVAAVVDRVDVAAVVDRVDLDAAARRLDLDAIVDRLDLDAVVGRVDLDGVARRIDLDAVAECLDLDRLVSRVDVAAVVARIDLVGLAEEVIAAIDLPEILRQSSGAVASEAIRGVRTGGVRADDAVAGFVDRVLRRDTRPNGRAPR